MRAAHDVEALLVGNGGERDLDGDERRAGRGLDVDGVGGLRAAGDVGGDLGGAQQLVVGDLVRIGVARLVAGDHADAGALADAEDRAFELALLEEDRAGDALFDVDVGELAALGESLADRPLEEGGIDGGDDAAGGSGFPGGLGGEEGVEQGGRCRHGHASLEPEL